MKALRSNFRRFLIPLFASVLVANTAPTRAGLVSALLSSYDGLEQSGSPRVFVAAMMGNDVPGNYASGPKLIYDANSGRLSVNISAAVISGQLRFDGGLEVVGESNSFYPMEDVKLYSVADVNIVSSLLPTNILPPKQHVYAWQKNKLGPMEEVNAVIESFLDDGLYVWRPMARSASDVVSLTPTGANVVAGVLDFGSILPHGLTRAQISQLFANDQGSFGYVDYANHRGFASFRAPLSLNITAEPDSAAALFLYGVLMCFKRRGLR